MQPRGSLGPVALEEVQAQEETARIEVLMEVQEEMEGLLAQEEQGEHSSLT